VAKEDPKMDGGARNTITSLGLGAGLAISVKLLPTPIAADGRQGRQSDDGPARDSSANFMDDVVFRRVGRVRARHPTMGSHPRTRARASHPNSSAG
jgi:hypothetical protein